MISVVKLMLSIEVMWNFYNGLRHSHIGNAGKESFNV